MKKQFSDYAELEESFNDQAGPEGLPISFAAYRRRNIHPIKSEPLNRFENKIGKENWEGLVEAEPPNQNGQCNLQYVRGKPEVMPEK